MYEYCSVIIKKYSRYTIPSLAPKGFSSVLEPPHIDKWQHLSVNCTLQFKVLLEDSGQVALQVILNNSTFLEHIRLPLGSNHDSIQFSCKCPIISCKYISEEFGPKVLKRFQINLSNEMDFNRIVISLKNLSFIVKTAKTSIARNTMINQTSDFSNSKKGNFNENNNAGTYRNSSVQFQTQNMVMDFSQIYQEKCARELNNCSNITFPMTNLPMTQQNFPTPEANVEHFSQDLNTPSATQTIPIAPEPLSVKLLEASPPLSNKSRHSPTTKKENRNTAISFDLLSKKGAILHNGNDTLNVADLPKKRQSTEDLVQIRSSANVVTTLGTSCNLVKKNATKQNKEKVDNKLSDSQNVAHTNEYQKKKEIPLCGPINGLETKMTLIQEEMMAAKKTSRDPPRKISKRLIKEKLKDEEFMKWVCTKI
ncbi:hypothetical protein GRS66_009942 [Saccharomyces pastorianus]|uniref:Meiotic recombination protein REC114 n=1 Tax=Saccharomyces pastorianus TaxID=27292 RepID=A0A6C1EEA5_SACPS|nr:hypothetical protein GRS66_009942 [Saccharomyces pastorianus]